MSKSVAIFVGVLLLAVGAIYYKSQQTLPSVVRWYTTEQVHLGATLFANNCAVCHKPDASGESEWRRRLEDGSLRPPPLNGSAHTWHHSMSVLRDIILKPNGVTPKSKMPSFDGVLNAQEVDAVIAYFQNKWSDKIYHSWSRINQ